MGRNGRAGHHQEHFESYQHNMTYNITFIYESCLWFAGGRFHVVDNFSEADMARAVDGEEQRCHIKINSTSRSSSYIDRFDSCRHPSIIYHKKEKKCV